MHCLRFIKILRHSKVLIENLSLHCMRVTSNISPNFIVPRCTSYSYSTMTASMDETEQLVKELSKNDPDLENKLKLLMLEVSMMREEGRAIPDLESLKKHHWEQLITLPSKSGRFKYLQFLWKNEKKKENLRAKKDAATQVFLEYKKQKENEPQLSQEIGSKLVYSLSGNSLFLRIYERSVNHYHNLKLMQTMMFGQKLIVDCSYDKYMTMKEAHNAGKQLSILFAENRVHDEPFDLNFVNCNMELPTMKQFCRIIPTAEDETFPLHMHKQSYLDLFPKEKLVYLTPHCREELTHYDHDAIYIIGCMVDKVRTEPLSLAKAKEHGLKMAKFPLDRYLQWGVGSTKSLTINQVVKILLDLKATGDWEHALKNVPRRKVQYSLTHPKKYGRSDFTRGTKFDKSYTSSGNFSVNKNSSTESRSSFTGNKKSFTENKSSFTENKSSFSVNKSPFAKRKQYTSSILCDKEI